MPISFQKGARCIFYEHRVDTSSCETEITATIHQELTKSSSGSEMSEYRLLATFRNLGHFITEFAPRIT
jgi:hypothetical protein